MPDAFLAGAPPVNKLTLLKSNKDLREGDEEKKAASENCVLEEKMDTQSTQKTKRKQRRKNGADSGGKMEVEAGCKGREELQDETGDHARDGEKMEVSQKSNRSRSRRKKEDNKMDTSQTNDT